MRISYNFLKDFLDLKVTSEKLAADLSLFGFDCQSLEKNGDDMILDLEITPNRGDCLSHLGIAREIAAYYGIFLKKPFSHYKIDEQILEKEIHLSVSNPKICPRFTARVIDNLKVKDSPEWLKIRLNAYGIRPINNIVDITNYIMIALGQPLHAFDYNKIYQGEMTITQTQGGKLLKTLDGQTRLLPKDAIIIRDKNKIYDLAGIMGGKDSEVSKWTRTIILQGAIFDPVLIRLASKKIKLSTEASYRYERGVDFGGTCDSVNFASYLLKESCPEAKLGKLIDKKENYSLEKRIELGIGKLNKLLGTNLNEKQAEVNLKKLNFQIINVSKAENKITVSIPSYRQFDVKIWQDLAEEVARVHGYNNILKNIISKTKAPFKNKLYLKRETIKDQLTNAGFTEIYSYSFTDKNILNALEIDSKVYSEIANPISKETKYLRESLLPSIMVQIAKNPWSPEINIFEIGKVFPGNLPEKWQIIIATVGKSETLLNEIKNILNLKSEIKNIDQNVLAKLKIRRPVKIIVEELDKIILKPEKLTTKITNVKYRSISKYSPTVRDLAFVAENIITPEEIIKEIKKINKNILIVELFDEFKLPENFGRNKKNLAFHIWMEDPEKPIEDDLADQITSEIIKNIEKKFKAKLRS